MKRLVPEQMIPSSVLESLTCEDARPGMGLIQMNTLLLKSSWRFLRFSSREDAEPPRMDPAGAADKRGSLMLDMREPFSMVGVVIARLLGYLADPPPGGQKESVQRRFVGGL